MQKTTIQALNLLKNIIKKQIKTNKTQAVFVSAGVDSSIIAKLVCKLNNKAKLITLITDKSKDLPFIKILADHLDKKIEFINVTNKDIAKETPKLKKLLTESKINPLAVHLPIAVGFYFLCYKAKQLKIDQVFTGQGPDVLFAGYHRYQNLSLKLLNKQIKQDLNLLKIDQTRDNLIAKLFEIKLINPYLDSEFVEFSFKLSPEYKINPNTGENKYLIRQIAKQLKLPKEIYQRKKMALQYSTGLSKKTKL
ncbi:MAG: hypothetical protein KatS3mg090_0959 [Patescibacteria group bacterium]|nr:MAG: hypothetical protein KatS3mg090_0959 [Patescibacteria group bacterium]